MSPVTRHDSRSNSAAGRSLSLTSLLVSILVVALAVGFFFVLLETSATEPGSLDIAEVDPGDATIGENDTVALSVTVENTGSSTITDAVELSFANQHERALVTLDPGETETITLDPVEGYTLGLGETTYDVRTKRDERVGAVTVVSHRLPYFELDWTSPTQLEFGTDGRVDIATTVTNTGGQTETQTVRLRAANETVAARTLTLGPGESETFRVYNFSLRVFEPGERTVSVHTEDDVDSRNVTIPEPARLELLDVESSENPIAEDGQFELSARIANAGELPANRTLSLELDGEPVATQSVDLAGRSTGTVEFSLDAATLAAGPHSYELRVGTDLLRGEVIVEGHRPPVFRIQSWEPGDVTLTDSPLLNVSAEILNDGGAIANESVSIRIEGEKRYETSLEIPPRHTETFRVFNLDLSELEPGVYEYSLRTYGDSETATLVVEERAVEEPDDDAELPDP